MTVRTSLMSSPLLATCTGREKWKEIGVAQNLDRRRLQWTSTGGVFAYVCCNQNRDVAGFEPVGTPF